MATTKKYLDYDGLVAYTAKVKKAISDAEQAGSVAGVTDIDGTTTAPTYANDLNATATSRTAAFTKDGSADSFPYYDTTYGDASTTKDGLMTHEDKTKLDGIATGAEVNVQSDWNQTTTTSDDYIKNKPTFKTINSETITGSGNISLQTPLTFDDTPTASSNNPVKSGGVKTAVDNAAKTVRHTEQSGTTAVYPMIMAGEVESEISSGSNYEVKYSPNFSIQGTSILIGSEGVLNETSYTGKALQTETDLATTTSGSEGAKMIGYGVDGNSEDITVKDALDDLYSTIGGGGGSSIMDLIEDLQDGDNLIQGTNVTLTKDTANHTVTIAAADPTVTQTSDTSTTSFIPLLLASGATPTSPAGAKYNSNVKFKPSTRELQILGETSTGSGAAIREETISIKDGVITFTSGSGGMASTGTISGQNYSGTSAKATADGSGNNIVNTYATKAALDALTNKWTGQFKIATGAEAIAIANKDASVLELGYIYLVLDSSASSPNIYDEYIKAVTISTPASIEIDGSGIKLDRKPSLDHEKGNYIYYGWKNEMDDEYVAYTRSETPQVGDSYYDEDGYSEGDVKAVTPAVTTYSVEKIGTTDAGVDVVSLTTNEINTIWSTTAAAS